MTSTSQPNNATPQRLQLAPQTVPRMPFSSPMGEEILSPTSPYASRSPPQHQIRLSQNRGGQEFPARAVQTSVPPKPTKGEWGTKQDKGSNKLRWQGLHVATNFSKPPLLAQKTGSRNTKQDQGLGLKQQQGPPVPSRTASIETLGLGHQQSKKSLKSSGSKGRIGDLARASSKVSNLSPSDRAVVIGLSVSPEDLAEHATSPEDNAAERSNLTEQHATDKYPSVAPAITVTPANEQAPWSVEEGQTFGPRRRAPSSVYSLAAPHSAGHVIDPTIVPPIPPLPPDAKKHNAQLNRPIGKSAKDTTRALSTCTVFEDEDAPVTSNGKSDFRKSQLRVLTKQASMDTIATRHRSQGWWNHIVSPFFPKSPMSLKFSSSTPPRELIPAVETTENRDCNVKDPDRLPYKRISKSGGPGSCHTSWTDSTLEAECEKRALAFDDDSPHKRHTLVIGPQPFVHSPPPAKFEGVGAAAEYYEACLYDMHSPEPFFECQNHTCLPRRTESMRTAPGPMATGTKDIGEELGPDGQAIPHQGKNEGLLAVQQAPKNRFSAAFHEAITSKSKARPDSEATMIEDLDTTPDVREAQVAPVVRAPAPVPATQVTPEHGPVGRVNLEEPPQEIEDPPRDPPAYSSPKKDKPAKKFVAVMPPSGIPTRSTAPYETRYEQPMSPEPVSPGMERHAPRNAFLMAEVHRNSPEPVTPMTLNAHDRDSYFQEADRYDAPRHTTMADLYPPSKERTRVQRVWETREKALPPRVLKGQSSSKCRNCFSGAKPKNKKEKRIMIAIATGLVLLIILILILAMTLTRKSKSNTPVQSPWLNLTGYPPIPTGFSTIIQPDNVDADSDCVEPQTLWSCALPKEEQQGISPSTANQPNFRVEILFQNGTNATANVPIANTTSVSRRSYGSIANPVSAGGFIRHQLLRIRQALNSNTYTPSPSPPSLEDQTFLGNTTDDNAAPFDGEYTPFYMTFDSAAKLSSRLFKRQSSTTDNSSNPFPDPTTAIPPPDNNPDGTAAGANLYPYPSAQPLRLYNRGLPTEHYGFYNYFDRSIFLKSTTPINGSSNEIAPLPDDENGGAPEDAAAVRCTWTQTRFLVQIWTKKSPSSLLQSPNTTSTSHTSLTNANATSLNSSSANDFTPPGSFPYPVTITLDRHGGDISTKMIYCYGMDASEHIIPSEKKVQLEARGIGGKLVNPALGPFGHVNVTTAQGGPGGIDGGSGGCKCLWQNWT